MTVEIHVLHVDEALIVVDKPAGLLSVPGRGPDRQDCAAHRVQHRFADALVVHRLDMATSGLLLFARGAWAQRCLSQAFAQRRVLKRYIAIVAGRPDADQGTVTLPLIADWPNRPRQQVDLERGKPALTHWQWLSADARHKAPGEAPLRCSRLALEPVTGRAHQLRVHMSAIGHPVLGDALYAPLALQQAASRLLLHASALSLRHPGTGDWLEFVSAPPF